jgi:DNA-binding PadR family transcriptional regulator
MRLEAQGWLEARWEEAPQPGKPARHLYRLTALGAKEAPALLRSADQRPPAESLIPTREGGAP